MVYKKYRLRKEYFVFRVKDFGKEIIKNESDILER